MLNQDSNSPLLTQPHNTLNQTIKTTLPPAPNPSCCHHTLLLFFCQPDTHQTLECTYTHAPSANYHSSKHRLPTPTFHATTHLQYHILSQGTHKTPTNTTHITTSTLASISFHVHQQYRPTITHHENNNNQSTKTTKTTTQRPQHCNF